MRTEQIEPEKCDLRERTKSFALRIIRMYGQLPKKTEAQILGKQVLRSGTSIGANYREAFRARSKPEFIAKCGDSLRESEETAYCSNSWSIAELSPHPSWQRSDTNAMNSLPSSSPSSSVPANPFLNS